ncbi:hypothetical protein F5Y07DRAFT_277586 [Xylaria sp. FL0933]|nr:hypothetical protein F5Y07DRAFT_277586 [Xylaria sp. FL0933]
MDFFNFPPEIRLKIYSEVLIQDDTVEFRATYGGRSPGFYRLQRQGLSPAVLRTCKTMNAEALPLLYSGNCFGFPDSYTSTGPATAVSSYYDVPYIAPFLQQISSNTPLLRHITINFPPSLISFRGPALHEEHIRIFQLIQTKCTHLKTIEILALEGGLAHWEVNTVAEMLKMLDDSGLEAISSLKKILMVCGEYEIGEKVNAFYEHLVERLPSSKWCIELKKIPPRT